MSILDDPDFKLAWRRAVVRAIADESENDELAAEFDPLFEANCERLLATFEERLREEYAFHGR